MEDPQLVFNPPFPLPRIEQEDEKKPVVEFKPTGAPVRLDHSNQVQERRLVHDTFTSKIASYNAAKAFAVENQKHIIMIIGAVAVVAVVAVMMKRE